MKFIPLTFILYYIQLTSVETAGEDIPITCCLKVSHTTIPLKNLLDYYIQKSPPCNIRAIRFLTIKNKTLCWDPDENWAKMAMAFLDATKTTQSPPGHIKCRTSTSTSIPTTPIKTPGSETKTSSRTVPLISTAPSTVTTLKTPGSETKTSSKTATSISTLPSTLKTSGLQTESRTTSTEPATESTEGSRSSRSSTNACIEPKHSTETSHNPPGKDAETPQTTFTSTTTNRTTKTTQLPKLIQRKRSKKKKQLRKYQMSIGS